MRVLLIEDDVATAQSIELMLKSEGFNVYGTDLGEEGVDLGKLYDYDIILLAQEFRDHGFKTHGLALAFLQFEAGQPQQGITRSHWAMPLSLNQQKAPWRRLEILFEGFRIN